MTNDGSNSYTYTVDGMQASVNGVDNYTYDADLQRVRKDTGSGSTEYVYFGGSLLAARDVTSGSWTDYIYGTKGVIAEVKGSQNATPTYRLADSLGSPAQARDSSGNLIEASEFMPYGQMVSGSSSDRLWFTGLEWDGENSSYHAQYRQYSPAQGRWLAPDPYDGSYSLEDPQTLNRYAYVRGNPLAYTDASGLDGGVALCSTNQLACIAGVVYDIFKLGSLIFGSGPEFHGSLKPRPGHIEDFPNGESLGIPAGMSIPQASDPSGMLLQGLGVSMPSPLMNESAAAASDCQNNGQSAFTLPFTKAKVTVSLSTTVGPVNYSSTNDVNSVAPISSPWKLRNWLQFGGSVDITYNAPTTPSPLLYAGSGRNLSLGRFVTKKGFQGWNLSLGPSIGPPTSIQAPLGNICGWVN